MPRNRRNILSLQILHILEHPEGCVDPSKENKESMLARELDWLRSTRKAFGGCGKLIYVNGKPVGYVQYAPPKMLPRSREYSSEPPSEDAVLISCLFIARKEYRGM